MYTCTYTLQGLRVYALNHAFSESDAVRQSRFMNKTQTDSSFSSNLKLEQTFVQRTPKLLLFLQSLYIIVTCLDKSRPSMSCFRWWSESLYFMIKQPAENFKPQGKTDKLGQNNFQMEPINCPLSDPKLFIIKNQVYGIECFVLLLPLQKSKLIYFQFPLFSLAFSLSE